jgi:hypothetical protein
MRTDRRPKSSSSVNYLWQIEVVLQWLASTVEKWNFSLTTFSSAVPCIVFVNRQK